MSLDSLRKLAVVSRPMTRSLFAALFVTAGLQMQVRTRGAVAYCKNGKLPEWPACPHIQFEFRVGGSRPWTFSRPAAAAAGRSLQGFTAKAMRGRPSELCLAGATRIWRRGGPFQRRREAAGAARTEERIGQVYPRTNCVPRPTSIFRKTLSTSRLQQTRSVNMKLILLLSSRTLSSAVPEKSILDTRPRTDVEAVFRTGWWTEIVSGKNVSLVQLLHPDHGWLTFVFPAECAGRLGTQVVKHTGLCEYFAGTVPPSTVAVN